MLKNISGNIIKDQNKKKDRENIVRGRKQKKREDNTTKEQEGNTRSCPRDID